MESRGIRRKKGLKLGVRPLPGLWTYGLWINALARRRNIHPLLLRCHFTDEYEKLVAGVATFVKVSGSIWKVVLSPGCGQHPLQPGRRRASSIMPRYPHAYLASLAPHPLVNSTSHRHAIPALTPHLCYPHPNLNPS